jgi:hypothetical protein
MRAGPGQLAPVGGDEAAQGKPGEIAPAREHHDEQDGEEKARDGVADDDRGARPHVERRAVADRLGHAQGDRHEVDDERAPEAERDRHGHLLDHQGQHRAIAEEALAEIEDGVALEHLPEAHVRGLVESVELLQLLDEPRVEAARAAVPVGAPLSGVPRACATSPPRSPDTRAVGSPPVPCRRAIIVSTGPPGATCTMAKFSARIPRSVGTMSRSRRSA